MDWIVHGVEKSWTRLSDFHFHEKKRGKFLVGLFRLWKQHILVCCEMTHLQSSLLVAGFKKRPEQGKALQVQATLPHRPFCLLYRLPPIIRQIQ